MLISVKAKPKSDFLLYPYCDGFSSQNEPQKFARHSGGPPPPPPLLRRSGRNRANGGLGVVEEESGVICVSRPTASIQTFDKHS
jgi:hypothetical protein